MKLCSWIWVFVLLPVVTSCSGVEVPKVAFGSNRDGNWEIYVMNGDGSGVANLSKDPSSDDVGPKWSSDGSLLAFDSNGSIAVVNLDGELVTRFAPETHLVSHPSWSPDGEKIAFHSTLNGNFEVYTMPYTGGELKRLTIDPLRDNSCPDWSPSSDFISFGSHALLDAAFSLRIMHADGTELANSLVNWSGSAAVCPLIDWSPDGLSLASISRNLRIDTFELDSLSKVIAECAIGYPEWSPDGNKIAFAGDACTNSLDRSEIYTVNRDGTNLVQLTVNAFGDHRPAWSPDGERIAFVSLRDGNSEIYVMNADGTQQTNLTQNAAEDDWPEWQR